MEIDAGHCRLRPYGRADRERITELVGDRRVWRNMTHRLPHPYSLEDADRWLDLCAREGEATRTFAIEVDGKLAGGIGLQLHEGVKRHVGTVGYWVAPSHWNRGIATHALEAVTRYAFDAFGLHRLQATVFGWNPASGRVLEKCGFVLEGRLRHAILKDGELTDELWYGLTRRDTSVERPPSAAGRTSVETGPP